LERVHSSGAKFDYEKAKWFNHEWIKKAGEEVIVAELKKKNINYSDDTLHKIALLVKERCTLLSDIRPNSYFFFETPAEPDIDSIKPKWNDEKTRFFEEVIAMLNNATEWNGHELENQFKQLATAKNIKPGEVLLPLRIMLVGKKMGPGVFEIAEIIGKEETIKRIKNVLNVML
jgi:glutamyl-tRNA synthetase